MTYTAVLQTLYSLTHAEIGAHSREHDPYSPEIRRRWQSWYEERGSYLYSPPMPAPKVNHHYGGSVSLDVEAWMVGTPTREYRKTHPLLTIEDAEKKPEVLREFCLQRLMSRLWQYGRWNYDAFDAVGAVDDPRCLAALQKIAQDKSAEPFA